MQIVAADETRRRDFSQDGDASRAAGSADRRLLRKAAAMAQPVGQGRSAKNGSTQVTGTAASVRLTDAFVRKPRAAI